jgi:hypothetical protein
MGQHKIADWYSISQKVERGENLTSEEVFVYEFEPAGRKDANDFRSKLADLIIENRLDAVKKYEDHKKTIDL